MFLLVLFILSFSFSIFGVYKTKNSTDRYGDWSESKFASWLALIVLSISLFVWLLVCGSQYYQQINSIENIQKYEQNKIIYTHQADDLTAKFKVYLADLYPNLEKEIFNNISASTADVYLVKYPQLRSSDTIMELVSNIKTLRTKIYNQDIAINQANKDIRTKKRNPFIITWVLPTS